MQGIQSLFDFYVGLLVVCLKAIEGGYNKTFTPFTLLQPLHLASRALQSFLIFHL